MRDGDVIRKVVVGADGSTASAVALRWAADFCHAVGATAVVVHAAGLVERAASGRGTQADFEDDLRRRVEREWCAPFRDCGVLHQVVVRSGPPVATLLDVAADGADLVVVGRRGAGSPDAPQLGSSSLQLVAESVVPVVVVAHPA